MLFLSTSIFGGNIQRLTNPQYKACRPHSKCPGVLPQPSGDSSQRPRAPYPTGFTPLGKGVEPVIERGPDAYKTGFRPLFTGYCPLSYSLKEVMERGAGIFYSLHFVFLLTTKSAVPVNLTSNSPNNPVKKLIQFFYNHNFF